MGYLDKNHLRIYIENYHEKILFISEVIPRLTFHRYFTNSVQVIRQKKFRFFTTLNNFDFFVSNAFFQDSEMKNVLQLKTLFIMSILLTFGAKIESCPTRTLLLNCVFQNSVKAQSTSFWTKIKPMSSAHYKHHVIYLQLLFTRTSGRYLR